MGVSGVCPGKTKPNKTKERLQEKAGAESGSQKEVPVRVNTSTALWPGKGSGVCEIPTWAAWSDHSAEHSTLMLRVAKKHSSKSQDSFIHSKQLPADKTPQEFTPCVNVSKGTHGPCSKLQREAAEHNWADRPHPAGLRAPDTKTTPETLPSREKAALTCSWLWNPRRKHILVLCTRGKLPRHLPRRVREGQWPGMEPCRLSWDLD